MAWVRTPHSGTLPSRHSPSKKVQVCDQPSAITPLQTAATSMSPARYAGRIARKPACDANNSADATLWSSDPIRAIRVRRLRHLVRFPRRRRPSSRGGGARRHAVLRAVAAEADRIHLDPHARRPLCRILDADPAGAGLLLRAVSLGRPQAPRRPARRLSEARCLSRRADRCSRAEGARRAHRDPDQRFAGDGRLRRSKRPGSRPSSTRCFRSTPSRCSSRVRRSMRWSPRNSRASPPRWCSYPRTAGTPWAQPHSAFARSGSTAPRRRTNTRTSRRLPMVSDLTGLLSVKV